jgi:hypothetical protein
VPQDFNLPQSRALRAYLGGLEVEGRMQTALVGMPRDFWERDWIRYLFDEVALDVVEACDCVFTQPSILLLSDSDGRHATAARRLLGAFAVRSTPVCLVHLSDEYCACPIDFYRQAGFVVRNYYRPSAAKLSHCLHVPLGYKAGFTAGLVPRPISERRNAWFFAGEVKGRRRGMLTAANRVPNGRAVITARWDDPNGLSTEAYAQGLADAVYAPCPRGNDSVDSFRVWEALEAGAIPIVEDDGAFDALLCRASVPATVRSWIPRDRGRVRYRALFGPSYWGGMFGTNFPVPRIRRWQRFPEMIARADPVHLSRQATEWWNAVKQQSRHQIRVGLAAMLRTSGLP